jgi:hypothetical protein
VNYEEARSTAVGHIFKASRFHDAPAILTEIDELMADHGMGFVNKVTYNPDSDPIYLITIKVERQ